MKPVLARIIAPFRLYAARTLGLLLASTVAACGGNDGPAAPEVVRVEVTPSAATLEFLGQSLQLTARAVDGNGQTVGGVDFGWASSDPTIVDVDATGVITALAEGSAEIRATTLAGISGGSAVTSAPVDCEPTQIDLAPGEAVVLPLDCTLILPSGAAGHRYRVAVVDQDLTVEELSFPATSGVSVSTRLLGAATSPVQRPVTAPSSIRDRFDPQEGEDDAEPYSLRQERQLRMALGIERRTRAVHERLREAERQLLTPILDRARERAQERAAAAVAAPQDRTDADRPGLAQVQDLPATIQLRNNTGETCSADAFPLRPARVIAQNAVAAVVQDSAQNANPDLRVSPAQAQAILDYYEAYGVSVIDDYFTGLPDLDGNGKFIVYVAFSEPLSAPATAAYAWAGDLLSTEDCETSNEAELAYFNADLIRAITEEGFEQALPTTVHEAKHVASFWHGRARAAYQPNWIEEGTAEVAGELSSRNAWAAIGGPAPQDRVTADDFRQTGVIQGAGGLDTRPEALGVEIRLRRIQDYLSDQPNGLLATPNGAGPRQSIYGSGWAFFRWLGDTYGNAAASSFADASVFRAQVDSTTPAGIQGINQVTGATFQELLERFATGIILHRSPGEDPTWAFTSYDFVDTIEWFCWAADNPSCLGTNPGPAGSFPWPVNTGTNGEIERGWEQTLFSGAMGGTGIYIAEFVSDGSGNDLSVAVEAELPARIVVGRTN